MALLQNIVFLSQYPLKQKASILTQERCFWNQNHGVLNKFVDGVDQKNGVPSGSIPPYSWEIPIKGGGMATFRTIAGTGNALPGSLSMGVNIISAAPQILGNGGIQPSMTLAYHFIASITALGGISSASMSGAVRLIADLLGEGDVPLVPLNILSWCASLLEAGGDITLAELLTPLGLTAKLEGSGGITSASLIGLILLLASLEGRGVIAPDLKFPAKFSALLEGESEIAAALLKGIAWCVADIIGEGTLDGSDSRSKMFMKASITSTGEIVTAQSCAAAVWNTLATAYNESGTMGNKMNSAASSGDPWTGVMDNYTDDATFGAFVKKLLTTNGFFGLR